MATEIKPAEAAQKLGITLNHLYSLIWAGRLEARKSDGRWLVSTAAVETRRQGKGE